jgi:hypothetical protein
MRTRFKNSINYFGLNFLILFATLVWASGCTTPNPVKSWKSHNANFDPPNTTNYFSGQIYHIDTAILDDYPKFIEQLKKENPDLHVSEIDFYEDGTGQHAVKLTIEKELREYVEYYVMYDKSNVRTKVIKGKNWHQSQM